MEKLPAMIIGVKDDLHGMPAFQQNKKKIPVVIGSIDQMQNLTCFYKQHDTTCTNDRQKLLRHQQRGKARLPAGW